MLGSLSKFLGLEASLEVATSVLQAHRLEDVASRIAASIGEKFEWDVARVWNVDETTRLRPIGGWKSVNDPKIAVTQFAHLANEVARTRKPRWVAVLPERHVSSGAWIEIGSDEQVLGVIELLSVQQRDLDARQVAAVSNIGREIGRFLATRQQERTLLEQERSARALAYRATLEAQSRFRALFKSDSIGVLISMPDGAIEDANDTLCRLLGYTRDEVAALTWQGLEMDAARECDVIAKLARGNSAPTFEVAFRHKQGHQVMVQVTCAHVGDRGEILSFILPAPARAIEAPTLADSVATSEQRSSAALQRISTAGARVRLAQERITSFLGAQAASERTHPPEVRTFELPAAQADIRFEALFNSNVVGLMITRGTGQITDTNDTLCKLLGRSRDEIVALGWRELTPPGWDAADNTALGKLGAEGMVAPFEKELVHASGERIPVLVGVVRLGPEYMLAFVIDNRGRKTAESELAQLNATLDDRVMASQAELRQVARHIEIVREDQQAKLSREIHDVLGQDLTGLRLDAAWVARRLTAEQGDERERLVEMQGRIDSLVGTVREIATGLRPKILDDLGLVPALQWQARAWSERSGVAIELDAAQAIDVDHERATAAFRIFQEMLTNVARHARARCVKVRVWTEANVLRLDIADDGRGMTPEMFSGSLGLLGARERARNFGGELVIDSAPGAGTLVRIQIPCEENQCVS